MNNIKKLISALPPPHKQLLCSLCVLLRKISEHAKVRTKQNRGFREKLNFFFFFFLGQ